MKMVVLLASFLILVGMLKLWPNASGSSEVNAMQSDGNSFAVVELFTSEGCSSCPPADKLLGEIVEDAGKNQQRIFALAFHVDYWDYIGWKDPFADRAYSGRQRQYAQAFRSRQIYTPQMVVNGQREFVGSDRSKAESAIAWALSQSAPVTISLRRLESAEANELRLSYQVESAPDGTTLQLALVERNLKTDIKRGENAGRSLRHDNVVRSFKTLSLEGQSSGEIAIEISNAVSLPKSSIIAYAQNPSNLQILGAARLEIHD